MSSAVIWNLTKIEKQAKKPSVVWIFLDYFTIQICKHPHLCLHHSSSPGGSSELIRSLSRNEKREYRIKNTEVDTEINDTWQYIISSVLTSHTRGVWKTKLLERKALFKRKNFKISREQAVLVLQRGQFCQNLLEWTEQLNRRTEPQLLFMLLLLFLKPHYHSHLASKQYRRMMAGSSGNSVYHWYNEFSFICRSSNCLWHFYFKSLYGNPTLKFAEFQPTPSRGTNLQSQTVRTGGLNRVVIY